MSNKAAPSSTPRTLKTFERRSVFRGSVEDLTRFHDAADALRVLTPPPLFVQMVRDGRISLTQGEVIFRLWLGPLPVTWVARHEPGSTPTSFIDRMIAGPMASWEHEHRFRAVQGGVELTDRIRYAHKPGLPGLFSRLMFDGLPLRFLFWYRHLRTRRAMERGKGAADWPSSHGMS
ncbi:MAG: SRPBCC family protein [Anaerolineae bacterium]|nr:SRPBCC family protein [Anaerolineae bacterium]